MTLVSLKPVLGVIDGLLPVAPGKTLPLVPKLPDFQAVLGNLLDMFGPAEPTDKSSALRNTDPKDVSETSGDEEDRRTDDDAFGDDVQAQVLLSEKLTAREQQAAPPSNESSEGNTEGDNEDAFPASAKERISLPEANSEGLEIPSNRGVERPGAEIPALPSEPEAAIDDADQVTSQTTSELLTSDQPEAVESDAAPQAADVPRPPDETGIAAASARLKEFLATKPADAADESGKEVGTAKSGAAFDAQDGFSSWKSSAPTTTVDESSVDDAGKGVVKTIAATNSTNDVEMSASATDDAADGSLRIDAATAEFSMDSGADSDAGKGVTSGQNMPSDDATPVYSVDIRTDLSAPAATTVATSVKPVDHGAVPLTRDGAIPAQGVEASGSRNDRGSSGTAEAVKSHRSSSQQERVEFIDRIVRAARVAQTRGQAQMKIVLQPRHLGNLKIDVMVEDKVVTGTLRAESAQTKELIVSHLNELKDALHQQGLKVGDFSVTVQQENAHSPFDRQERQRREGFDGGGWAEEAPGADEPVLAGRPRSLRSQMVDVLA